jgi:SAM-dependent methyltransferase
MEQLFEKEHVEDVYNQIALHFSHTRNRPWNKVKEFTDSFTEGEIIGDIGCGNGKNMGIRKDCIYKGCDVSQEFVNICQEKGLDVIKGNCLDIPFEDNSFDKVMNIAVLHHLSTEERRVKCLREIIRILKVGGIAMIQVWALEQPEISKKKFAKQDNLIPWHLQRKYNKNDVIINETKQKLVIYERFYHVFKKGELEGLIDNIEGVVILESFEEYGNYGVIVEKNI